MWHISSRKGVGLVHVNTQAFETIKKQWNKEFYLNVEECSGGGGAKNQQYVYVWMAGNLKPPTYTSIFSCFHDFWHWHPYIFRFILVNFCSNISCTCFRISACKESIVWHILNVAASTLITWYHKLAKVCFRYILTDSLNINTAWRSQTLQL